MFLSWHIYVFQNQSTLYSCLNVKEFLAWSRCEIWSLSDCNWTWTQHHLVHKRTLNHLAKLARWLSCVHHSNNYSQHSSMLKWLSVCLWTKWLWVWVQLQKLRCYHFFIAEIIFESVNLKQMENNYFFIKEYISKHRAKRRML